MIKGQSFLVGLLALLLQVLLVQLSFNYLGPKFAVMHGKDPQTFKFSFFESLMLLVLFNNLFLPILVVCRR